MVFISSKISGKFSNDVVSELYKHDVLDKISSGDITLKEQSLVVQLSQRQTHVFRGGVAYDDDDTTYVEDIIKEVKHERVILRWEHLLEKLTSTSSKDNRSSTNTKTLRKRRRSNLKGRRIMTDGIR